MTELGQTSVARELIPGDPAAVGYVSDKLKSDADKLVKVGGDLKRVDVPGWSGEASAAFFDAFSKEPLKWLNISDTLEKASSLLLQYRSTLEWAQAQATEAIALWEDGESLTARARAEYQSASAKAREAATGGGAPPLAPFSDPGERARREAQELLERAREQLKHVGEETSRKLASGSEKTPGLLGALVDIVADDWKSTGKAEASGPGVGLGAKGPADGKLGELKAFAQLGKASAEGTMGNDFHKFFGKAEAYVAAQTSAAAAVTDEGLKGQVEAAAGGKASAGGRVDVGPLGASAKAEGFAGAKAGTRVTAGKGGFSASADAFAGAKGVLKGGADVGGLGVNVVGEGWAGAGAEAEATFGKGENGKWHVGANAGASLPVGGKLGFEVTVDPAKVSNTVSDAADVVGKAGGAIGDVAGEAQHTISGWL